MSTDIIQPFDFKGHQVRTLTFETGQTWWVLADVAKVLGVQNASDLAKRLDQDERSRFNLGRQGEGWIANESGLYKIVLRSDKPEAREFQRWVTHDVLPTIRRHGAYMSTDVIENTLSDPDYLVRLAQTLKKEKEARALAEKKVGELEPKAIALDVLSNAEGTYSISEAAKLLSDTGCSMRVKDLTDWLSSNKWIYRRDGHWLASQDRIKAGHLLMRSYSHPGQRKDGTTFALAAQVRLTTKGLNLIASHITRQRLESVRSDDVEVAA
ncbi:phage antirepressor Ant [Bifidobacterium indicum]|nr:phage antirepressor KilAC domain-containing protein [Bifidobacterium indicum]PXY80410.1 phage antirepressor Ant [Bifidobacterium indicum]